MKRNKHTQRSHPSLAQEIMMQKELSDLKIIRFPWEYNRYPVFFVGNINPGLLVGVAAFRLDR